MNQFYLPLIKKRAIMNKRAALKELDLSKEHFSTRAALKFKYTFRVPNRNNMRVITNQRQVEEQKRKREQFNRMRKVMFADYKKNNIPQTWRDKSPLISSLIPLNDNSVLVPQRSSSITLLRIKKKTDK